MPRTVAALTSLNTQMTQAAWLVYVAAYDFGKIPPSRVVLHHTYIPNEAQWRGISTLEGMQDFYANNKRWNAAPHVFAAPDGIFLMTPMKDIGIHAGIGNSGYTNGKLWYSIGLEMVGYFDKVRPAGAVWENSKAVLGGLSRRLGISPHQLISFHRDYTNQKSCPGWAVTKEWVWSEVERWLTDNAPQHPAQPVYTENSSIVAATRSTPQQAASFILSKPHGEYTTQDVQEIVAAYHVLCGDVGVDATLAIAQMIHETGNLSSFWAARPRRNPAGIGVNGIAGAGVAFRSWRDDAIPAHVGRLLAYALAPNECTATQQLAIDKALAYRALPVIMRGSARTIRQLGATHNPTGQGWAYPGGNYGIAVSGVMNAIMRTS